MTLKEMSGAYRDQAEILRERIRTLRAARLREKRREERFRLGRRISGAGGDVPGDPGAGRPAGALL